MTTLIVEDEASMRALLTRLLELRGYPTRACADAEEALATFADQPFDLVILDPPTFSSAKGGRPFTALKDYAELTQAALEIVAPGGLLCAASNAAKLDAVDLERALARGGALAKRELLITDRLSQPPDFPQTPGFSEASYLKLYLVHVR